VGQYLAGGEPFELTGGDAGVLALHGFTGSPYEVRDLAELLHGYGFSVFAPALAGHATTHTDLDKTTADDYVEAAEQAFEDASRRCDRLYVAGLSMGGTLGLHLAEQRAVAGVITISTPVFLYPVVNASVPLLEQWMPGLRTPANFAAWQGNVVGYKSTSIQAVRVVVDVLDRVRAHLAKITAPLLVVHSTRDLTVPTASARTIYESVGSEIKHLELIDAGSHLMTVAPNLSLIGPRIVDFLRRLEGAPAPEGA